MADSSLPVIVSGNRFNDLQPYSSYIYKNDPKTWGAVFPWEFPQNASKEVEETFLRQFFSETEIHVQGGAHGPGFKFLKQVWYCNALWNLDHRIPAVEAWYWEQPDSMVLLNDPKINEFFFKPDVRPATFFKQAELDLYGEKFLSLVIPRIQRTARSLLEEQQATKDNKDGSDARIPDAEALDTVNAKLNQTAAHPNPRDSLPLQINTDNSHAIPSAPDLNNIPYGSALPSTGSVARPRVASNTGDNAVFSPDLQPHTRKRGNSSNKRFNNGSGRFTQRQPPPFGNQDRGSLPLSSPIYGPNSTSVLFHPRGPPGGPVNVMHSNPPGQPLHGAPSPFSYYPGQYRHGSQPPQNMVQPPPFEHQAVPVYYSNNAFIDRSNGQFMDRDLSGQSFYPTNIPESHNDRGGHRRNSQGSRGGKPRGFNSNRARGGRGRNSFATTDRSFTPQGEEIYRRASNDFSGPGYSYKARRGSIISEKNWRSGSEHPQVYASGRDMKENSAPDQAFSGAEQPPASTIPYPGFRSSANAPYEFENKPPYPSNQQVNVVPRRPSNMDQDTKTPTAMTEDFNFETICGQDWVGYECTPVRKLIAFDVPSSIPEQELTRIFCHYAQVTSASRAKKLVRGEALVFMNFPNHLEARRFLLRKPSQWLDGRKLNVQVPREYWDRTHLSYHKHWPSGASGPIDDTDGNVKRIPDSSHIPTILQRTEEPVTLSRSRSVDGTRTEEARSENTTPTPSGASTPKKKKPNKKSKKTNDLRKTSLAAFTDQRLQTGLEDENSDAASVTTAINREEQAQHGVADEDKTQPNIEPIAGQKLLFSSEPSELQTSSEPSFTPTENIETRLPQPDSIAAVTDVAPAVYEEQRSSFGKTEIPVPSESSTSPTENIITPSSNQDIQASVPFREQEKEEEKTKAGSLDQGTVKSINIRTEVAATVTSEAPSKAEDHIDDSFHTASDSPASDKHGTIGASVEGNGDAVFLSPTAPMLPSPETAAVPSQREAEVEVLTEPPSVVSPTMSERSNTAKDKKVHVPQLLPKPKVVVSIAPLDATHDDSHAQQLPTSGNGTVPPTPAFVTAPNTPVVAHNANEHRVLQSKPPALNPDSQQTRNAEVSTQANVPDVQADGEPKSVTTAPRKADKSKGPSHTESLSLFGRKKEKKPKTVKKGTLKGKPSQSEQFSANAASGHSSRVVSGTATPTLTTIEQESVDSGASEKGGADMLRADSKFAEKLSEQAKTQKEAKKAEAAETGPPPSTQQTTPSKTRGKIGNFLTGIFGGGQQSQPCAKEPKSDATAASKNWLTGSKAHDHPRDTEIKQVDHCGSAPTPWANSEGSVAEEGSTHGISKPSLSNTTATQAPNNNKKDSLQRGYSQPRFDSDVGLGISNILAEQHEDGDLKAKKGNKKPRKKKRKSDVDGIEATKESSPTVQSKPPSEMYHFTGQATPSSNQEDDPSEKSSHTMEGETPSSDIQSPTSKILAARFQSKPSGSGHLLGEKQPAWKYKKRVPSAKVQESLADTNTDEEVKFLYIVEDVSDSSEQNSQSGEATPSSDGGSARPGKIFLYVGCGLRDEMEHSEVEQSKEKLQQLALEELKRKHGAAPKSLPTSK